MTKIKSWVAIGVLAQATASMAHAASGQATNPPPTAPVQGITAPLESTSTGNASTGTGSTGNGSTGNTSTGASASGASTSGTSTSGTSTSGTSTSGTRVKPVQKAPIQSQSVNSNPSATYASSASDADWKNPGLPPLYNFGALTGLGIIDSYGGLAILGTASVTIMDRGFISDISNSVATEVEAGPMITSGHAAFWYGLHLRWDFQKDNDWTFYALGGLGGNGTPSSLGGHFEIWPRFGAGAMYKISSSILLRGEVSHEFTGIGISVPFM